MTRPTPDLRLPAPRLHLTQAEQLWADSSRDRLDAKHREVRRPGLRKGFGVCRSLRLLRPSSFLRPAVSQAPTSPHCAGSSF